MHQKGKDYNEFRNFVSVSQLKQTSTRDVATLFSNGASLSSSSLVGKHQNKVFQAHQVGGGKDGLIHGFDDQVRRRQQQHNDIGTKMKSYASSTDSNSTIAKDPLDNLHFGSQSPEVKQLLCERNKHNEVKKSKSKQRDVSNILKKQNIFSSSSSSPSSRSSHDFLRLWKQNCQTAQDTLKYLTRINNEKGIDNENQKLILSPEEVCQRYFQADIDSEIIGNVVSALHLLMMLSSSVSKDHGRSTINDQASSDFVSLAPTGLLIDYPYFVNNKCTNAENDDGEIFAKGPKEIQTIENVITFMKRWLTSLSTCGRFSLGVSFLILDEKLKLKELFGFIKENETISNANCCKTSDNDLQSLYEGLLK